MGPIGPMGLMGVSILAAVRCSGYAWSMKLLIPAMLAVIICFSSPRDARAAGPYEDVPVGALPADAVKGALQKTLSPQGRFVILAANGTVRIFDTPEKIAAAPAALAALQSAPAMISFAIVIKTGMHKVTKVASTDDGVAGTEFPYPNNYIPPQVVSYGKGYAVIPAQPTNFTTRRLGAGDAGYPNQGGYVTGTVVTTSETGNEGGVQHRYSGSTVFPKPVAVTVNARVPDVAALHDWAVKSGAGPQNEPALPGART